MLKKLYNGVFWYFLTKSIILLYIDIKTETQDLFLSNKPIIIHFFYLYGMKSVYTALLFLAAGLLGTASAQTLEKVMQMQPVALVGTNHLPIETADADSYGLKPDQLEHLFPGAVTWRVTTIQPAKGVTKTVRTAEVDYQSLVPVLIQAVKEQQAEIDQLRKELNALKGHGN